MPQRKLNDDYTFTLFEKADSLVLKDWESITNGDTVFLEPAYLKIVERSQYTPLLVRYVIVYFKSQPCGIIYYQVADFNVGVFSDLLDSPPVQSRQGRRNIFEKYIDSNRSEVLMRLFTCGNNLVSGEYAFLFNNKINEAQVHALVLAITGILSKEEKLKGFISATLIKDFHQSPQPMELFKDEKYSTCFVEPNMVVDVPVGLSTIDDYIALFSKKYRNRAKAIFKSFEEIKIHNLEFNEIQLNEKQLYKLYENIFDRARFKLNKLPQDYFSSVKQLFAHRFFVKAFFLDETIVAFASYFIMPNKTLEAHYVGIDYNFNNKYNLYQNILYMLIGEAIQSKTSKVNLGRTASEIKSTVGAKAQNLICLIKPQNTISKFIQKPFMAFLQPSEWTPRNPFKEETPQSTESVKS